MRWKVHDDSTQSNAIPNQWESGTGGESKTIVTEVVTKNSVIMFQSADAMKRC